MRYESSRDGYAIWRDGRECWVGSRSSTFTLTRRGTTLAMRLARRSKKVRWTQSFTSTTEAERGRQRIHQAFLDAGFKILDGEDIKLPSPDPLQSWKDACIGAAGDDARLVYADLLTERRDTRGELIVAQAQAEDTDPYSSSSNTTAERIMKQQRATFLGPFAERAERGHVHWRRGFVDALILERHFEGDDDFDLEGLLVAGLTHPSGSLIRELTVGMDPPSQQPGARRPAVSEVVALLCALAPPGLEVLTLRAARYQNTYSGDLTPLFASLPRLTHFTVEAREITFSTFTAPMLVELTLDGPLSESALEALSTVTCPRLERLEILGSASSSIMPQNVASDLRRSFGSRLVLR